MRDIHEDEQVEAAREDVKTESVASPVGLMLQGAAKSLGAGLVQRKIAQRMSERTESNAQPVVQRKALYRGMTDGGGVPKIGPTARTLGIRPDTDVTLVPGEDGKELVKADGRGMSVAPDDPRNLADHRRPPEWGGTGRDPVWQIDDSAIAGKLHYHQDSATHGNVAAAREMPLDEMQQAIAATQPEWKRVPAPGGKK